MVWKSSVHMSWQRICPASSGLPMELTAMPITCASGSLSSSWLALGGVEEAVGGIFGTGEGSVYLPARLLMRLPLCAPHSCRGSRRRGVVVGGGAAEGESHARGHGHEGANAGGDGGMRRRRRREGAMAAYHSIMSRLASSSGGEAAACRRGVEGVERALFGRGAVAVEEALQQPGGCACVGERTEDFDVGSFHLYIEEIILADVVRICRPPAGGARLRAVRTAPSLLPRSRAIVALS